MIVVMMMMMMLVVVVSAISLSRPSHSMSTNCFVCLLSSWMHFDYNKEMPQKYLDPWHINFFCLSSSTVFTDEMLTNVLGSKSVINFSLAHIFLM